MSHPPAKLAALFFAAAFAAHAADCTNMNVISVPGAEMQVKSCLDDLSTPYLILTNHTDASDWGTLHSVTTRNPSGAAPGIQIDGRGGVVGEDCLADRLAPRRSAPGDCSERANLPGLVRCAPRR